MDNYTFNEIADTLFEHLRIHTNAISDNSSLPQELYDWHLSQIRYYTLEIQKNNNRMTSKSYSEFASEVYHSIKNTIINR
jgi:hypothetical protein